PFTLSSYTTLFRSPLDGVGRGLRRCGPTVVQPRPAKRREHLEAFPAAVAHPAGCHRVRGPRRHQVDALRVESLTHPDIALPAVWAVVRSDVDRRRVGSRRHAWKNLGGVALHDQQTSP